MPKILYARPAADAAEEKTVRKLAGAKHAPADWIHRARLVVLSWDGLRVPVLARELGCHEQTVRRWLVRFNVPPEWTLDALTGAARAAGIEVHRSQVRRIPLAARTWLEDHPRISQVFIPVGACWLNLQEGWWRLLRKAALAGQSFTGPGEIEVATALATAWLNAHAQPWIWGRPSPLHRQLRRRFVYRP